MIALEPLPNPLPLSDTSIGFKKIPPSETELLTFRVEEEERDDFRRPSISSSTREMVDCETPRVITWTDLTYDPTEYSLQSTQLEPIFLGPLSAFQTPPQEDGDEIITTSRSDQSDYEPDWNRASQKLRR